MILKITSFVSWILFSKVGSKDCQIKKKRSQAIFYIQNKILINGLEEKIRVHFSLDWENKITGKIDLWEGRNVDIAIIEKKDYNG